MLVKHNLYQSQNSFRFFSRLTWSIYAGQWLTRYWKNWKSAMFEDRIWRDRVFYEPWWSKCCCLLIILQKMYKYYYKLCSNIVIWCWKWQHFSRILCESSCASNFKQLRANIDMAFRQSSSDRKTASPTSVCKVFLLCRTKNWRSRFPIATTLTKCYVYICS